MRSHECLSMSLHVALNCIQPINQPTNQPYSLILYGRACSPAHFLTLTYCRSPPSIAPPPSPHRVAYLQTLAVLDPDNFRTEFREWQGCVLSARRSSSVVPPNVPCVHCCQGVSSKDSFVFHYFLVFFVAQQRLDRRGCARTAPIIMREGIQQ